MMIAKNDGAIAQLVEQRTENPCVPGSIPGGTTPPFIRAVLERGRSFVFREPRWDEVSVVEDAGKKGLSRKKGSVLKPSCKSILLSA